MFNNGIKWTSASTEQSEKSPNIVIQLQAEIDSKYDKWKSQSQKVKVDKRNEEQALRKKPRAQSREI